MPRHLRTLWRRLVPALALLVAVAQPVALRSAAAQPAPPPLAEPPPPPVHAGPSDATAEADRLAEAARDAYRNGKYAEAVRLFEQAFAAEPRPKFIYNMARAKEKLAAYKEAVHLLERYLTLYRQQNAGADPSDAADITALIRALKQRAFDALPEVTIASTPPGAQVLLNGATIGTTPLTTHLEPGRYKILLRAPHHTDLDAELVVPESGTVRVVLSLKSTVKRAALSFWCNVRGAQIAVDGKVMAVTPFTGQLDVDPGPHQIAVNRAGYKSLETVAVVPADKELHSRFVLEPTDSSLSWRSYLGWPLVLLGGGAVGGGAIASYYADQEYAGTPRFKSLEQLQNGAFGGGGAAAGLGLLLVVWDGVREAIPDDERVSGRQFQAGSELRPLGGPKDGQP